MAYLHDTKHWGNRKKLQLDTIITDLEYDMAIVVDSWEDLKVMLDTTAEICKGLGLSISCTKTKTWPYFQTSLQGQSLSICSPTMPLWT